MTEPGYYLREIGTGAIVAGPFPQMVHAFRDYVVGQTEVVHRRATGEVNLVFAGCPYHQVY